MNVIEVKQVENDVEFYKLVSTKPRMMQKYEFSNAKVGWSLAISMWGKYIKDETETYLKMFDNDFALLGEKLPKVIKDDANELKAIKNMLRPKYKSIR